MLKVFTAEHQAQAHLVENLLRSNGIGAHVVGESLLNTIPGASVIPGTAPEVWVLDSEQGPSAIALIRSFLSGQALPEASGPAWTCPDCAEVHESQFSNFWKCGAAKPSPTTGA